MSTAGCDHRAAFPAGCGAIIFDDDVICPSCNGRVPRLSEISQPKEERRVEDKERSKGYMPRAERGDWQTPENVLAAVREAFGGEIDIDPCAGDATLIGLVNIRPPKDGLVIPWAGRVFVNPPFSDLDLWAPKCAYESREAGASVILLLPARTDTVYWHEAISTAAAICFWKGRVKFVGAGNSRPFPIAFAYWGGHPWDFHAAFKDRGMVVSP